jgi:hypothetical protein
MTMVSNWSLRSVLAQLRSLLAITALTLGFATSVFAQANPNQGPGGPILVVTSNSATFSKYYAEILRAEGFNEFTVADVSTVTSSSLASYDVVILGKVSLTSTQVTTLTNWVNGGGNLIAMDPDTQLASLLGLNISGTTLANGYIAVDTTTKVGNGIVGDSMQYHGTARLHTLNGATRLATLYANSTSPTASSAISLRNVGANGGQAAAFAYDLATSIVYTRQGNPVWAGTERDGLTPIRSDDFFYGNAAGDPQTDWIDRTKIAIPQADEQQRLLANLILEMNSDRKPLPRFWYLPNGHKAAVVMTGDDHANAGTRGRWNEFLAASDPGCNLDNWECIRGTSYLYVETPMTNAELVAFEAQGFEVGVHINTGCDDYTQTTLTQIYNDQLSQYHGKWTGLPNPRTMRHHCIVWSDWASGAKVELANGIRLDTNYYYWPGPNWVNNVPGHMTGSAIPMRFADTDGTIIDVYQAVSQMTDESGQTYPFTVDTLLDRAVGAEEQYGVYTVNAHTDADTEPESTTTVASAKARGVPVVTARQMLVWLDGRNSSSFGSIAYTNGVLTFSVTAATGSNGLQGMLPLRAGNRVLSTIKRGTTDVSYEVAQVKGVEYATFPATTGGYTATYLADTTAPTVTQIVPANGTTGVNPAVSVKVTFSEAIDAGSAISAIDLRTATNIVVPSAVTYDAATRTISVTPSAALAAGSTYTVTVRGGAADPRVKDLVGNALAATSTTTFTTNTVSSGCPCSGWTTGTTPAVASVVDPAGVELGVKFRANVNGFVTGLRFYKGDQNTGPHIGNIWSSTGQNLGTANFQNESANGWQTVMFAQPIQITANTTYVASYYTASGNYAADGGYFGSGRTAGPLYFFADSESGGNGVYAYGSTSTFPTGSWNSTNYWVDVIFDYTPSSSDSTPPTVAITSPTGGATYTSPSAAITLSGTASDANGIAAVTWSNNRGGSGTALGTTNWSTSAITLQLGSNVITVTARDAAGNLSATTLTVTYSGDTTAPTITTRSPTAGATGVSAFAKVLVTFNESINPSSVTTTTVELRAPGNVLVPSTVAYNAASLTATLTPNTALNPSTVYTVNVKGGTAPAVQDLAGNALAATSSWTFTTSTSICPCSVWDGTATPVAPSVTDSDAVEVGVKFRSTSVGSLTGIRFYKGPQNTGTHTAHLWSITGQLLGTATFINETASGWQTATFDTPIAIEPNTTYVASYHAPNGGYAADSGFFNSSGVTRAMLTALQNGQDGDNGVYKYGPPGSFPDQSWNASNYWVDVVFSTTQVADTTPPVITSRVPVNGATNVTLASPISVTFNESLDPATVTSSTFELRNTATNALVASTVSYNAGTSVVTIQPTASLIANTGYTVNVRGGTTDPRVKDASGNALAASSSWSFTTGTAAGPCAINEITAENCLTGNLPSEWDIVGSGDASIQGFATQISVNRGSTVQFKIDTPATSYRLDIYRMGYYGGRGARKITSVNPSATLPQNQDDCAVQATTGLIDCGNWNVSASWAVPANAVSGIYFAKVIRTDGANAGKASHIFFIVRNDASNSKMVFQTSDTTWQAYNNWGGNSLYVGGPGSDPGRAYKVSYNRPFNTREVDGGQDWVFNAEYPMVRWLEANGYDITYISGVDTDRAGSLLQNHRIFLSVGHDEYWSGQQRANVEAARNAGVNLAFFSGNEVFWKTRWENSIDGSNTPYRTLVSYKETHANAKIDPTTTWTGTWRDGRFSADGGKPENALTGTIFKVNSGTVAMQVPGSFGKLRFWRNTQIAGMTPSQTYTLPEGTVGYEWDEAPDASAPAGLVRLSQTVASGVQVLQDLGSTYDNGTAKHSLTLYKHSSGALVFGAGTVQWSWGLDSVHDRAGSPSDINVRQATMNLFADMGVQPNTMQADLIATGASTDTTAPTATITTPTAGSTGAVSSALTISGTATDVGGEVGAVEVSVDGGATWRSTVLTHTTAGAATWSYSWRPTTQGSATIIARATDDSANRGANSGSVIITIGPATSANCPCSLFDASETPPMDVDTNATVTGVKFSTSVAGQVSALRFYKGLNNTGTHTGTLWNSNGTLLASVVFSGETASGWQQQSLTTPITLQPNVTYIVAYHSPNGRYSGSDGYFNGFTQESGPLTAPANEEVSGGNGVYRYGGATVFPDQTYGAANYWADVVFTPTGGGGDSVAPTVALTAPTSGATYSTGGNTISLAGTASDTGGVTQVTWVNDRGGNGTATGTTSWSVSSVGLQTGTNVVTISARDTTGNIGTKVLTVTYTPSADSTPPTVTITSPTSAATYDASSATVSLSGSSADAVGVTQVTWSNSLTGGSGTATGTTNWAANNIPLQVGLNTITVTSRDAAGNMGTGTLAVTFADSTAPSLSIVTPQASGTFSTSANTVTLTGTASDNVGVTQVTWSNSRGNSGTASGTTAWTASGVRLANGANVLTITARDAAGNPKTATLTVNSSATADSTKPTLTIQSPSGATVTTTDTVSLSGIANDNDILVSVTWSNNRGGNGTASGTNNWSVSSVALQPGANVLTVTAKDLTGNTQQASVTVTFNAPITYGLVAAYGFNEGSGGTASDASGNNNSGTVTNATWSNTAKFGKSLQFNGSNARVWVPSSGSLNLTSGMTLMAWVRPTNSLQLNNRTILRRESNSSGGYWLYAGQSGLTNILRPGGGAVINGSNKAASAGSTLSANNWTHVALTYDGTNVRMYINGTLSGSAVSATGSIASGSLPLWIGGNNNGEYFQGQIDEVRVYSRALSATEIGTIKETAITP